MGEQKTKIFLKLVCERLSVFEKEIEVDKNFGTIDEIQLYLEKHSNMLTTDRTWIIYPMSITI